MIYLKGRGDLCKNDRYVPSRQGRCLYWLGEAGWGVTEKTSGEGFLSSLILEVVFAPAGVTRVY